MEYLIALAIASFLTGCVATMVNAPGDSGSPHAPVNEQSRGGTLKYLNQGADFVIKDRRADAYKQMYQSCKGKYRIDSEGPKAEGGYATKISDSAVAWGETSYWYIQFSCVNDE